MLLPVPKPGDDSTLAALKNDLAGMAGKTAMVESTAGAWGGDRANAPRMDWQPVRLGANPPSALVQLHETATREVLAACGVPVELVGGGDGAGQREAWRRFLFGSIAPLGRLVSAELSAKLDTPITLTWDECARPI